MFSILQQKHVLKCCFDPRTVSVCARATELLSWLGEEDLQLSMPYKAVGIS